MIFYIDHIFNLYSIYKMYGDTNKHVYIRIHKYTIHIYGLFRVKFVNTYFVDYPSSH